MSAQIEPETDFDPACVLRLRPLSDTVRSARPLFPLPTELEDTILQKAFIRDPLNTRVDEFIKTCATEASRLSLPSPFWRTWLAQRLSYLFGRVSSRDMDGHWTRRPLPRTHRARMRAICWDIQRQLLNILDGLGGCQQAVERASVFVLEWAVNVCEKTLRLYRSLSVDPPFGTNDQSRWGFNMVNGLKYDGILLKELFGYDGIVLD